MCTAFVKNGASRVVGFNFDLDQNAFRYRVCKTREMFYIGISVGSTTYKTHGVNRNGNFGNLPYRNGQAPCALRRGPQVMRLDLLNQAFIAGKCGYAELLETVRSKEIVDVPGMSMHSLFSDRAGRMLLVEPGSGFRELSGDYAVITNYPVLDPPADLSPAWYGASRRQTAEEILQNSGDGFSWQDGLKVLCATVQGEPWATRVSFVYSDRENTVYYCLDGDFTRVQTHRFA